MLKFNILEPASGSRGGPGGCACLGRTQGYRPPHPYAAVYMYIDDEVPLFQMELYNFLMFSPRCLFW